MAEEARRYLTAVGVYARKHERFVQDAVAVHAVSRVPLNMLLDLAYHMKRPAATSLSAHSLHRNTNISWPAPIQRDGILSSSEPILATAWRGGDTACFSTKRTLRVSMSTSLSPLRCAAIRIEHGLKKLMWPPMRQRSKPSQRAPMMRAVQLAEFGVLTTKIPPTLRIRAHSLS